MDKLIKLHGMESGVFQFRENSIEFHYQGHILLGYVHIVPGILFLLLGGYQLIPYFRKKNYEVHRLVGKIFLLLSAVLFLTAMVLGLFYPFGDWLESAVTLIFGGYLLYATFMAYKKARQRDFRAHQNWVIRVYFVALSVSTIRGVIALFMTNGYQEMSEIFGLSFLIAFVLHFLLVELWIRYLVIPE
ncbi:MAG: DUF2306 domain-containing protein [Bacteroidota bacterium]